MPISLSAKKSLRTALKNYKENVSVKNKYKKTVKGFLTKPTEEGLKEVYSVLDKAVKKFIFHKNKVSRLKAKYSKLVVKKTETVKAPVKKSAAKKMS